MSHTHREKNGRIRRCDLDVSHLVGPEGGPLKWCNHGTQDPDVGGCVHAGTVNAEGISIGTPCDDPFLVKE